MSVYTLTTLASAGISRHRRASVCACVCVSVCLSHTGIVSKRLNVESRKQHHVIAQGIKFPDDKIRWWSLVDDPFSLKFALKVTHPLSNSAISTKSPKGWHKTRFCYFFQ